MTFIVEDGTGLEDANALVDVAFVDTFAEEMGEDSVALSDGWGNTDSNTLDEDGVLLKKQQSIIYASRWLSSAYTWVNQRSTALQSLAWPQAIGDAAFAFPIAVKFAVAEAAIKIYAGTRLDPDLARGGDITSEKVGPIEIHYGDNASGSTSFTAIDNYLRGLILGGTGTSFITTERL